MGPVRLVALVVAACTLVACTSEGDGSTSPTTVPERPGSPRQGGVLRVGVERMTSLDPAQARTPEQLLIADQLFEALTTYDPETLEPVPALASGWTVSPDQRVWEFTIRPDAVFAHDRPVTAEDVKFTLERIARRGSGSPVAELLEPVSGFRPFHVDGSAPGLAGVVVVSPQQVRITLDTPLSVLASVLGNPAFGVVPREFADAAPPAAVFAEVPVGSGPFGFADREGDTMILRKARGSTALLDEIRVTQYADSAAAYRAFLDGELDWVRVPPEQVSDAARRFGRQNFQPYLAELFYGINVRNPKFGNAKFRQAIVHAIDRDAIVSAIYGGTVRVAEGVVVPEVRTGDACGAACEHDLAAAKRVLAEAFPDGRVPEIGIDYDEDRTQSAVARAIKASLDAAGIPSVLRPRPLADYQAFAVSGQQELFRLGWIGNYPSPDAFLHPLFFSGAPSNLTGFAAPEVDADLAAARAAPTPEARAEAYLSAERRVLGFFAVVPIAQFELHAVVSTRTRGLRMTVMGTFDASATWVTEGLPS